jgi:hypothetical protein
MSSGNQSFVVNKNDKDKINWKIINNEQEVPVKINQINQENIDGFYSSIIYKNNH